MMWWKGRRMDAQVNSRWPEDHTHSSSPILSSHMCTSPAVVISTRRIRELLVEASPSPHKKKRRRHHSCLGLPTNAANAFVSASLSETALRTLQLVPSSPVANLAPFFHISLCGCLYPFVGLPVSLPASLVSRPLSPPSSHLWHMPLLLSTALPLSLRNTTKGDSSSSASSRRADASCLDESCSFGTPSARAFPRT